MKESAEGTKTRFASNHAPIVDQMLKIQVELCLKFRSGQKTCSGTLLSSCIFPINRTAGGSREGRELLRRYDLDLTGPGCEDVHLALRDLPDRYFCI